MKLVIQEHESDALDKFLNARGNVWVTSVVGSTETRRAVRRFDASLDSAAIEILESCDLVALTQDIWSSAVTIAPVHLRTLDAIHLATALATPLQIDAFVTYDLRLAESAVACGLNVSRPGS